MYSEPGSNRYGHYCPQDFKSGVSTYSTIRATQSPKRWRKGTILFLYYQTFSPELGNYLWNISTLSITRPNLISEETTTLPTCTPPISCQKGCRCVLDKEIAPDGTYLAYFPFGAMIERSRMTPYHKKLQPFFELKVPERQS